MAQTNRKIVKSKNENWEVSLPIAVCYRKEKS